MTNNQITIDYYSDLLCVWAWIAQQRINELKDHFGDKIQLRASYIDVFGDVEGKMNSQWADRGGYSGFANHVQEAVAEFPELSVHSDLWEHTKPKTSANAHLVLKAVEANFSIEASERLALAFRKAFFIDARDIGNLRVLLDLARESDIDPTTIEQAINDGSAMAALMSDHQRAKALGIKGSPSYVMNQGRQTLYGNVGYRVLQANVTELLLQPANEASWC